MSELDDFNAYEREMWETRAEAYARGFQAATAHAIGPLLDAAAVGAGTDVVDVGCGPGFVAEAALARGARVTGIDVAEAMVELATRRVPGATFRAGSAEELPLPDASFDAVIGNFVILHLGHPERAAAQARRVLRPGGHVAFSVWEPPATNRALGVFTDAVEAAGVAPPGDIPQGPPYFRFADRDVFGALLQTAGFDAVAFTPTRGTLRVEPGAWWDAVVYATPRTGPLIARQPPTVQDDLRRRYDAIVASYAVGDEVELPVAALVVSAVAPSA